MSQPNRRIPDDALPERMKSIPQWRVDDGRLTRRFVFTDFADAFSFMTRCAFEAERIDHHPDWSNVWNRVDVQLWSHDLGGISERCVALAAAMDRHARLPAPSG